MSEAIADDNSAKLARASNPEVSAWVSANAGSGKTHVLTKRVIRILLAGVAPSRILCLTYTKAAAAEMSNRVFATLGQWAGIGGETLQATLAQFLGRPAEAKEIALAPTLFALSLDSPGGLKIQTIHAFCEALLHQFPLEANVSGHFEVIESAAQAALLGEAQRQVILELERGEASSSALRPAFARLLELATDKQIEAGLAELTAKREKFARWVNGDVETAMQPLWQACGILQGADENSVLAEGLADTVFDPAELAALVKVGVRALENTLPPNSVFERTHARNKLYLTDKKTARDKPFHNPVLKAFPGLAEQVEREKAIVLARYRRHQSWKVLTASQSLFILAEAILERYAALKRRRGLADFADLITSTANLLMRSDVRHWVQYKLDRGIDHVLIDEAQDTSAQQWQIINALVEDFHTGASTRLRTMFAVGDEKQSIYSFQGADPRRFSIEAAALGERVRASGQVFEDLPLHLSYRSVPDVLEAVDLVFGEPDNFRGLSTKDERTSHQAFRRTDPGEVLIWPVTGKQKGEEKTSWLAPLDHVPSQHPAEVLAKRIASTISGWINNGEKLAGRDRRIACGDILILVRKRDLFSTAVIRQLKEHGLTIAGADRLKLVEHIAVEDLIALGRAVLMPEDDLSLACVLKSPLLGLDDDDLTALAANRKHVALIDHLGQLASSPATRLAETAASVCRRFALWRKSAAQANVYEFYADVLGREGGRKAFLSRLGAEASDVLDAFEQLALEHEPKGGIGLEDFIDTLVASSPEIKREVDAQEDAIRVITVHSAKGLEAPIVFLIDPCGPAFSRKHLPAVVELEDTVAGFLWAGLDRTSIGLIKQQDASSETAAEEEYRRLLYVGMTRAADRLVICGWHGTNPPKQPHWHSMVADALRAGTETVPMPDGWEALRWTSSNPRTLTQRRAVALKPRAGGNNGEPSAAAGWLWKRAAFEPPLPRPLTPSGAGVSALLPQGAAIDSGSGLEALLADDAQIRQHALLAGTLAHRLLQWLADRQPAKREAHGRRIATRIAAGLPQDAVDRILGEVLALLEQPQLRGLFGMNSRAEVNLAGHVQIAGRDVLVSGQIDRLAIGEDFVVVADFKTNRDVPSQPGDVPGVYLIQLGLYRNLLRQIYPGKSVSCCLIWTRNCSVTWLGDVAIDAALAEMTTA